MNHQRRRQRAGSVSDRSLATSASRSAPSSVASRHLLPQEGEGNQVVVVSRASELGLTSISGCAQADQSAHKFDRLVRVGALTNKGSHKLRESVRSARRDLKSNVDVSRASAAALTTISSPPRRAVGVNRPLRRAGDSRRYSRSDRKELREMPEQTKQGPYGPRSPSRRCDSRNRHVYRRPAAQASVDYNFPFRSSIRGS
jgi:hypothetical protein